MDKKSSLVFRLELVWWAATALVLAAVLLPIFKAKPDYPFWTANAAFIVVLLTLTRYLFFLRHTWLARAQWSKVVVLVLCLPLALFLVRELHTFIRVLDEEGLDGMFAHLPGGEAAGMAGYVRSEMLFFGAGSVIATVALPFRLLVSYWRTLNRGTV